MVYKINDIELALQPTTGRWLPRQQLGIDGNGHPVYPAFREFEMQWGLMGVSGSHQLQNFFETVVTTGSAVVDLPRYQDTTYNFFSYSGCALREPDWGRFFTEHQTNVTLLVTRIRT